MIITKEELFKKVKQDLKTRYPNDFMFSTLNKLWDFSVYTTTDDNHFKVIFAQDEFQILTIKNFLKGHTILNSKISRKYYIIYINKDLSFKYIRIV